MGCVVEGVDKLRWTAPEWIARNAVFFLLPHLTGSPEAEVLASRLRAVLEARATYVDLTEILTPARNAKAWLQAVDLADADIAAEDPLQWNDPEAYVPFRTAFNRLRLLAPQPVR